MGQFWKDLKAQKLKGRYVFPTASTVFPVTFLSSFVCVFMGIIICMANGSVKELRIEYGNEPCSCSSPIIEKTFELKEDWKVSPSFFAPQQIGLFYRIEGFYLSQRRLQQSHCWDQLRGDVFKTEEVVRECFGFVATSILKERSTSIDTVDLFEGAKWNMSAKIRAPMGTKANVMFNDTFSLTLIQKASERMTLNQTVPLSSKNIVTRMERYFYRNETNCSHKLFLETVKPRYWKKQICELEDGYQNVDFVVWMRPEFYENFSKIYRRIELKGMFANGLPKGRYVMKIQNNWALCNDQIQKSFILIMPSWYGHKDERFFIVCFVVGAATFAMGIFMLFKHAKYGKTLEEMAEVGDGDD